ncbi:hypothetical protein K435DRAFT_741674 [Dendrothele bispora CBS 962.96]|uniref:Zn(2)-C6 fungal-type domain-containing protein n=1 Tax=Dendrothele bispora (strain CBS 962.96) TaxID=1314807 RepID=A0A4V4HIU5_DENBC|nr:hypothetical protein K435DRAFT_741674 [Dendrothele bispora CBS 962.96]
MDMQPEPTADTKSTPTVKAPVVRGARACTTCRAAKMKCVGAEDGQKQCQRCKRANVECIFEKHRRGRKPGSKLSEASKMLRRLEKGLNNAKLKSQQSAEASLQPPYSDSRQVPQEMRLSNREIFSMGTHLSSNNELPPLNLPYNSSDYAQSRTSSRTLDGEGEEEEEEQERNEDNIFPAKLIGRENRRNSFFHTILNPEETPRPESSPARASYSPPAAPSGLSDPVSAGIMDEEQAKVLFDLIFLRLNPFVNLFDPALHSVHYVRSRSPFLFTVLLMAGCKFFKPELAKQCQKLANDFATKAFSEAWKSVEVVQAFACLTYWRDPDDNRTWTFIGYACRMAVELGLNRYVAHPPSNETESQLLERRNRERTYLVLFVHDRSLSTQTGRNWMLPEDDFIRHSINWHEKGGNTIRPEDVIVSAFVQLRHIAAETTEIFHTSRNGSPGNDINNEVVLRNCNGQLTQWMETWHREMHRAGGESFHFSFLTFFRLYVRLFTNSFGIQDSMSSSNRTNPSVSALSACYTSATDSLRIVSKEFASMSMLRYGQDSITIMSAYSAVFLLRLLRSASTLPQLPEGASQEVHEVISKTADAYYEASVLSPASSSAAYHARFLRGLLANDIFRSRKPEKPRIDNGGLPIDPRLQGSGIQKSIQSTSSPPIYPQRTQDHSYQFATSPAISSHSDPNSDFSGDSPTRSGISSIPPPVGHQGLMPPVPQHSSEMDAQYWRNMFIDLGFGNVDPMNNHYPAPYPPMHPSSHAGYGH